MTGGVVGVGALACAGLAVGTNLGRDFEFAELTCEKEKTMSKKVLVAYASKAGSTGEVAQAIGQVLCDAGMAVDVRRVQDVKDLSPYSAVVIGSAARMGHLLGEAINFSKRHADALKRLTTAYFMVGVTTKEDTAENRAEAAAYLDPLCQIKEPVGKGTFAGKVDPATLAFPWNVMVGAAKEGAMAAGDFRNWDAIRAWAGEIAPALSKA